MAEVEFVWYKHPVLCWSLGRVVKSHGVQITVADVKLHGEHTVNRAEVHPHDTSHDKNLNDIAFMNNMHEGMLRSPHCFAMNVWVWVTVALCFRPSA
jgi:hypothetical protein